jgi:hypothetical protein
MDRARLAEHLAVFVEVCRLGSFSAAARRRSVSHSPIARQIDSLEAELGVALLIRLAALFEIFPAFAACSVAMISRPLETV